MTDNKEKPEKLEEPGMTVDDLYNHILKHMTAEQALKMLLVGALGEYQKLKFSSQEEAIHPTMLIVMAAIEMGWCISIRQGGDEDPVDGMIVGTREFLEKEFEIKKKKNGKKS
jgi:hypothetical protein